MERRMTPRVSGSAGPATIFCDNATTWQVLVYLGYPGPPPRPVGGGEEEVEWFGHAKFSGEYRLHIPTA